MTDAKKKKYWSYTAGERGRNWVRAYEEAKTRMLYLEWYEDEPGGRPKRKRTSLGHREQELAKQKADELAAAFARRERVVDTTLARKLTLQRLFDRYLEEETPHKGKSKQGHDHRATALFTECFGAGRDPATLGLRDWKRFIRQRRSYEIAPPGTRARLERARERGEELDPVGDRQIEYDLKFLWSVLNWGVEGDAEGRQLLERNPLEGKVKSRHWPKERKPKRPRLTSVEYQTMLEVAEDFPWQFQVALVLAHETGHRIGSIRKLRWSDSVAIDVVSWRKENDKIGLDHETPLTHPAIAALQRARRESGIVGDGWILPSPEDPEKPCSRHIMRDWWDRAQEKAGIPSHDRRTGRPTRYGWHSLRRKFASELKDIPLKDLAVLGGWADVTTILTCYMQEDMDAMREALGRRRGYGDADGQGDRRQSA